MTFKDLSWPKVPTISSFRIDSMSVDRRKCQRCASAPTLLSETIEICVKQILGNASKVGAGVCDEEIVHRLRIGLRCLRTALRELQAERFGSDQAWEPLLRSAYRELGRHRDRAVILPAIEAELVQAGCSPLIERPAGHATSPGEVVRAPRLHQTLLDLLVFSRRTAKGGEANTRGDRSVRMFVARRLRNLRRLMARDAERFARLGPSRQHRVRKRLGRLICLSTIAAPLFGSERVTRYLTRWHRVERELGRNNDLRTANDLFVAQGLGKPDASFFALRWLKEQRRKSAKRCQRSLRKAAKVGVFWRR